MIVKDQITNHHLIQRLLETLQGLPETGAKLLPSISTTVADKSRFESKIELRVRNKSFILLIEIKKIIYPRDAREVIWQIHDMNRGNLIGQTEKNAFPFLAAESISPGAKEMLLNEGIGYFDSGGSLFFPANGAYIYIDKPAPKPISKSNRSLFSGRRSQVLHILLVHHQEWFGIKSLSKLAMVSPATASQVMMELERFEWIVSKGQGPHKERRLSEPGMLLDTWIKQTESFRLPASQRYYVPNVKAENLLEHVSAVFNSYNLGYAISYEAAAQRYAPFLSSVSQVRCRLLPSNTNVEAIQELGARAVSEGANLLITEAKSPGELLCREQVRGIWLDSPIQVYLDLRRGEGRAKELAEHLRKEKLGF